MKLELQKILVPIIFLVLFVFFTYGALLLGTMGMANWFLHWYVQDNANGCGAAVAQYLLSMHIWGALLFAIIMLGVWVATNFAVAWIVFFILFYCSNRRVANQISTVVLIATFHIFAMPALLWANIRQRSPYLRSRYRNKLKSKALRYRGVAPSNS